MMSPVLRGLVILGGAYAMATGAFVLAGLPAMAAIYLGGTYALSAIAAFLFSRGVLDVLVGTDRGIVFFIVLRRITDPLLALVGPLTPGFLVPFAACLYAAFLYYFLKVFLFGDAFLELPPLFIVLYLVLASMVV